MSGGHSTSSEPGGPGIAHYQSSDARVLRVDNKCQKPTVTLPTGGRATEQDFHEFYSKGEFVVLNIRVIQYSSTVALSNYYEATMRCLLNTIHFIYSIYICFSFNVQKVQQPNF